MFPLFWQIFRFWNIKIRGTLYGIGYTPYFYMPLILTDFRVLKYQNKGPLTVVGVLIIYKTMNTFWWFRNRTSIIWHNLFIRNIAIKPIQNLNFRSVNSTASDDSGHGEDSDPEVGKHQESSEDMEERRESWNMTMDE